MIQKHYRVQDSSKASRITGPLAWVLRLGVTLSEETDGKYSENALFELFRQNTNEGWYQLECVTSKMQQGNPEGRLYWQRVRTLTEYATQSAIQRNDGRHEFPDWFNPLHRTDYYYQLDWINYGQGDFYTYQSYHIPPDEAGEKVLWLDPETADTTSYSNNEIVNFGDNSKIYTQMKGTVDGALTENSINGYIEMEVDDDELITVDATTVPSFMSLFHIPSLENPKKPEDAKDSFVAIKQSDIKTDRISDIFRLMLGDPNVSGLSIAPELQNTWCPFFTTIESEGLTSIIDWNSMDEHMKPFPGQVYMYSPKGNDTIYSMLKNELLLHLTTMTCEWDYTHGMNRFKFRHIGPVNSSDAYFSGRIIDESKNKTKPPKFDMNQNVICHKMVINALKLETGKKYEKPLTLYAKDSVSVAIDDITIKVNPTISRFDYSLDILFNPENEGLFEMAWHKDYIARLRTALKYLSTPRGSHSRKMTVAGLFDAEVGKPSVLTDLSSFNPSTGKLNVEELEIMVTSKEYDITDEAVKIEYTVGGKFSKGIAPACMVTTGNHTIEDGSTWTWDDPEEHEFTADEDPEDAFFFDCFAFKNPNLPVARTTCSCGDYSVVAIELGTYDWTPLPFTCSVSSSGGDPTITLTGTTSGLDASKDYVIYFADYDDCETCQQKWIFHADDDNQIGNTDEPADRWV